jgi:hypothetical protein
MPKTDKPTTADADRKRASAFVSKLVVPQGVGLNAPHTKTKTFSIQASTRVNKHRFLRVHPDEAYQLDAAIFEDQSDSEELQKPVYLVTGEVLEAEPRFATACHSASLYLYVYNDGQPGIWIVKVPSDLDQKAYATRMRCIEFAKERFCRVEWVGTGEGFAVVYPEDEQPPPEWPTQSFFELVEKAFQDKVIDVVDHPVVDAYLGRRT